jgi:hypothetical protein
MSRARIAPLLMKTYPLNIVHQVDEWARQRRTEGGGESGMSFLSTRSSGSLLCLKLTGAREGAEYR